MPIDFKKVKERLKSLQTVTSKRDNLWKPEPGDGQTIRIVPSVHQKETPFFELYFHYNIGGKTYLSPVTFGEEDPLVELANKLRTSGDQDEYELSKKLTPKLRIYAPIIIRGRENEGVKYWGFGKKVYQEILSIIDDDDWGDITDPMNGRDIKVTFIPAEESGKSFPETKIIVKPGQTPISDKPEIVKLIGDQCEITDVYKKYTYSELEDILENWLNPDDTEEKTEVVDSKKSTEQKSEVKENVSDAMSEIEKLFNKKD